MPLSSKVSARSLAHFLKTLYSSGGRRLWRRCETSHGSSPYLYKWESMHSQLHTHFVSKPCTVENNITDIYFRTLNFLLHTVHNVIYKSHSLNRFTIILVKIQLRFYKVKCYSVYYFKILSFFPKPCIAREHIPGNCIYYAKLKMQ